VTWKNAVQAKWTIIGNLQFGYPLKMNGKDMVYGTRRPDFQSTDAMLFDMHDRPLASR
jgi:hypothetical protein